MDGFVLHVDPEEALVTVTVENALTKDVALDILFSVNDPDRVDPDYRLLIDLAPASEIDVGLPELKEIVRQTAAVDQRVGRTALVVGNENSGRYLLGKLYETLTKPASTTEVRVFKDLISALAWSKRKDR